MSTVDLQHASWLAVAIPPVWSALQNDASSSDANSSKCRCVERLSLGYVELRFLARCDPVCLVSPSSISLISFVTAFVS